MYRCALVVMTTAVMTAAAQDSTDEAINKEWARMMGTWKFVSGEINGKKLPVEHFHEVQFIYTADGKYIVQVGSNTVVEATTKIDPMKTPKTMDGTFTKGGGGVGKTTLGIYELKGDTLRVCFGEPGKDRPTKFNSIGNTLFIYKRDFLHKLIGTWECEEITKPAEWTPKEEHEKSTLSRKWVLNGRFVEGRGGSSNRQSIALYTYDNKHKIYRLWWFDSQGNASDFTGQWNEGNNTFTWKTERDGLTGTGTQRILDEDNSVIEYVVKNEEGKVFFHSEGKLKRKK